LSECLLEIIYADLLDTLPHVRTGKLGSHKLQCRSLTVSRAWCDGALSWWKNKHVPGNAADHWQHSMLASATRQATSRKFELRCLILYDDERIT